MIVSVPKAPAAVGMFDSGIGGLTVFRELRKHAPDVPVIYFGDTFNVPYGGKPLEQIRRFALNAIDFLVEKGVGVVAIACNVSSSVLTTQDRKRSQVPVFGLVAGGAQQAVSLTRNGRIGVIATEATVKCGSYQREILMRNPEATIEAVACPKFVPLVEAGERDTPAVYSACEEYLTPIIDAGCDTIVHGCTHYPFLEAAMKTVSGGRLTFVDPAAYLAIDVASFLAGIARANGDWQASLPETRIYLSKSSDTFVEKGSEFLGFDISKIMEVANINLGLLESGGAR